MTPKYMLDTNICIYLMKQQPPEVAARFAQCYVGEVVISAITLAELEFGIACSGDGKLQNRQGLDLLLEDIHVAAFDAKSAAAYGPINVNLAQRGHTVPLSHRERGNGGEGNAQGADDSSSGVACAMCVRYSTQDKKRDALDKLIAAHAVALGVVLVTNNESDFLSYPDLKIENWIASH